MQKETFKKLSILGLVLMAASAVTAAILPNAKSNAQTAFSLSAETRAGDDASTESCMPTVQATDDPCQDDSATNGLASGSTSFDNASDGATTTP